MALPVTLLATFLAKIEPEIARQYERDLRKDLLETRPSYVIAVIDKVRRCILIELFSAESHHYQAVRDLQTCLAGGASPEEGEHKKSPFLFAGAISVSKKCIPKGSCTVRRDSDTCEEKFGYDGPAHHGFPTELAGFTRETLLEEILEGNPDVQADNLEAALEEAIGKAVWTQLEIKPADIPY